MSPLVLSSPHSRLLVATTFALSVFAAGCSKSSDTPVATQDQKAPVAAASPKGDEAVAPGPKPHAPAAMGGVEIGAAAPDFTLTDTDGKSVTLSALKGKIVVLEWFNADCPFVKRNHGQGTLKTYGNEASAKGDVVWLAINSSATGKQGAGLERNKAGRTEYGMTYPVLLDESGEVGKKYGARTTPHVYVIDKTGNVAYSGSIDNAPDGDPRDAPTVINFVGNALDELRAGKPVTKAKTDPWGCSVKYKS
jgi:peroxiredoxin